MTEPLRRADPITAEALERMGFVWNERYLAYQSKAGQLQPILAYDLGCDMKWGIETAEDGGELAIYTTLGELADLCRCLKIELQEVPK